jgi:hypothetical protein
MFWRFFASFLLVEVVFFASPTHAADGVSPCVAQQSIPMTLERVGLFAVRLTVNGTEGRYLVDSGANKNTLDTAEAKRNNVNVVPYDNGLSGHGHATLNVAAGPLSLGSQDFSVMNLDFINIPTKQYGGEPFAGQLGTSFFTQFKATIDFAGKVICISAPDAAS